MRKHQLITLTIFFLNHRKTHQAASDNTHSREEGLHVLIGVCYRRQVHKVSVQHLLISVQVEIHQYRS